MAEEAGLYKHFMVVGEIDVADTASEWRAAFTQPRNNCHRKKLYLRRSSGIEMKDAGQRQSMGGASDSRFCGGGISSLHELLLDQLRDVYSVESQLLPALAELESMATAESLRQLFRRQVEQTRRQKERLEIIGRARGWDLDGDSSKAMEGLIEGGRSHVAEVGFPPARDFLIVAHAHRIKHYKIAAYAVTIALSDRMGLHEASQLLGASLGEEQAADEALARIAAEALMGSIPTE